MLAGHPFYAAFVAAAQAQGAWLSAWADDPDHGAAVNHVHLLDPDLASGLPAASAGTQKLVVLLSSADATERMRGLDAVYSYVLDGGVLTVDAAEALPHLFALATGKGYPASSALLRRLLTVLTTIDDPPRTLPAGPVHEAFVAALPSLLRVARRGRDPEAARAAALMAARFDQVDREVAPLLLAMVSGAGDAQGRAPFLYALARTQLALGHPLHRRVLEALGRRPVTVETLAAALALSDADQELARGVRDVLQTCPMDGWMDPCRPGALVDRGGVLVRLGVLS